MRYTVSNTINKPLEVVMEKFMEPNGAIQWMEGLHTIEQLSGESGAVGSKSNFHFTHKGKDMSIEETILERNPPNQIKFGYKSPMGYNEVEMIFEEDGDSKVKQINNSYFELKGMMKIMGFFMKGMFKKQSMKYLDAFKSYAEK